MNANMHLRNEDEIKVMFFEKNQEREEFYCLCIDQGQSELNIIATKEDLIKLKEVLNNVNL